MALLMLRELGFTPWQCGLALGLPTLGGLLGSLWAPKLVTRFGGRAVLLGFQPAFIAVGRLLAAATSTRVAIACAAVTLLASSLLLPWRNRAAPVILQ
ncbi:hypothetical protein [Nocardia sp. Marseille-Q1738]